MFTFIVPVGGIQCNRNGTIGDSLEWFRGIGIWEEGHLCRPRSTTRVCTERRNNSIFYLVASTEFKVPISWRRWFGEFVYFIAKVLFWLFLRTCLQFFWDHIQALRQPINVNTVWVHLRFRLLTDSHQICLYLYRDRSSVGYDQGGATYGNPCYRPASYTIPYVIKWTARSYGQLEKCRGRAALLKGVRTCLQNLKGKMSKVIFSNL